MQGSFHHKKTSKIHRRDLGKPTPKLCTQKKRRFDKWDEVNQETQKGHSRGLSKKTPRKKKKTNSQSKGQEPLNTNNQSERVGGGAETQKQARNAVWGENSCWRKNNGVTKGSGRTLQVAFCGKKKTTSGSIKAFWEKSVVSTANKNSSGGKMGKTVVGPRHKARTTRGIQNKKTPRALQEKKKKTECPKRVHVARVLQNRGKKLFCARVAQNAEKNREKKEKSCGIWKAWFGKLQGQGTKQKRKKRP